MPLWLRLLTLLIVGNFTSCVHLFITHVDYRPSPQPSGPAEKGPASKGQKTDTAVGVRFRAEFIPLGSESGVAVSAGLVGGATVGEIGPYQVRLHGFGKTGGQQAFRLTRFILTSPGNFTAPMESRGFAGVADFGPTAHLGLSRASLLLGPHFRLEKNRDKSLLLEAGLEVRKNGRWTPGAIRLVLEQTKTRRRESLFVLTEIWKDLRNSDELPPDPLPPPPEEP